MRLETPHGFVEYDYKHDLNDEEHEGYLPAFYAGSVIDLQMIKGKAPGDGTKLMEAFLEEPAVKAAKLIFLDCSPLYQKDLTEDQAMQRLHDFYARFGFKARSGDGYSRMWRIQALPNDQDACFREGYEPRNDFHPVLDDAIRYSHIKEKDKTMTKKMSKEEISASPIFKEALTASKAAVEAAATEANVSAAGFEIDGTFCDFGEIDTSQVADVIIAAAEEFGPFGSFNHSIAQDLLCIALNEHFKGPDVALESGDQPSHKIFSAVFIDRDENYGIKEALQGPFLFNTREEAVNRVWDYAKTGLAYDYADGLVEYALNNGFPFAFDPAKTSEEELSQNMDDLVPAEHREALAEWFFTKRNQEGFDAFFEINECELSPSPPNPGQRAAVAMEP